MLLIQTQYPEFDYHYFLSPALIMFGNISSNKSNLIFMNFYERDQCKFDQKNFILGYFSIDWEDLLKIDGLTVDNSTQIYLDNVLYLEYVVTHLHTS